MVMQISKSRRLAPVTALQIFWGLCAIVGLLSVGSAARNVPGPAAFFLELGQSWSSITVSLDLLFLGIPAVAFAVIESRRLGMRLPWVWIPLAVPLPGAFLIPLFFFLRERALATRSMDAPRSSSDAN